MAADALKNRTRRATTALIRRGELVPTACARCGADKTEAHHTSYADPRAVEFLCRDCHLSAHGEIRFARPIRSPAIDALRRRVRALVKEAGGQVPFGRVVGLPQSSVSRYLTGVRLTPALAAALEAHYPELHDLLTAVREEAA